MITSRIEEKQKIQLINRLSLAVSANECLGLRREDFNSCVSKRYSDVKNRITFLVERKIRYDPESLIDLMVQMGVETD